MENTTEALDSSSHVVIAAPIKAKRGRKPGSKNGEKKLVVRKALLREDGKLQLLGRGRPKAGATIVVLNEENYHLLVASGTVVEASPSLESPSISVG